LTKLIGLIKKNIFLKFELVSILVQSGFYPAGPVYNNATNFKNRFEVIGLKK
jgi:hypothetical protein